MKKYLVEMNGYAHARLGPVVMNVCHARFVTDDDARGFIERSVAESGGDHALVTVSCYVHHVPTAKQRQIMFAALEAHGVPTTLRQSLLTDSALLRGAMTAFGWLTGSDSASYTIADRRKALTWLSEKAPFDVDEALGMLDECFRRGGISLDSAG